MTRDARQFEQVAAAALEARASPEAPFAADGPELRPALLRLAYRLSWNWADAEDAVQNALLLATRRQGQLLNPQRQAAWLRSIVVRQCHDARRSGARRRLREARHPRLASETEARVELSETAATVRSALQSLPQRQQLAIVLRDLEQLEYPAIAEIMEIRESTVRALVRDARDALRARLAASQPAGGE